MLCCSLCSAAVAIDSLASLITQIHFLHCREIAPILDALINYGDIAYTHVWYEGIVVGTQDFFSLWTCLTHLHWYVERALGTY